MKKKWWEAETNVIMWWREITDYFKSEIHSVSVHKTENGLGHTMNDFKS